MSQMGEKQSAIQTWKEQTMEPSGIGCNHDCRITCKMLTEALLEEKSRMVLHINQKLNEIRARGQVSEGIISSFEPDAI
jgi:hypothetical protein